MGGRAARGSWRDGHRGARDLVGKLEPVKVRMTFLSDTGDVTLIANVVGGVAFGNALTIWYVWGLFTLDRTERDVAPRKLH